MCNFMSENDRVLKDFYNMSFLGLQLFKQASFGVQQVRSLYLSVIEKEDIWDTKNSFRNQVNRLILRDNFLTETMEDLEQSVMKNIKEWIHIV